MKTEIPFIIKDLVFHNTGDFSSKTRKLEMSQVLVLELISLVLEEIFLCKWKVSIRI